ncbi:MAG: hypothetical protein LBC59_09355 [Chitinispirillales bacterium]|jgi:hypothetical protein|nr:hypothetical protein [Chitinispirillales bacterium]
MKFNEIRKNWRLQFVPKDEVRSITDVRYVCAVAPMTDDENVQRAFWHLYAHKGHLLTAADLAKVLAIPEEEAQKALTRLCRSSTACASSHKDDEDGETYYGIQNVFFEQEANGIVACVVGHALSRDERDEYAWEIDRLMTTFGLEFAGD